MKGYIIEKASGRMVYYGRVEDKMSLHDDAHELLKASDLPSPPNRIAGQDLLWDGTAWKLGPEPEPRKAPVVNLNSPTLAVDLAQALVGRGLIDLKG